jgi:hypothetical protein
MRDLRASPQGSRDIFPQTGTTGCYRPEYPSSRGSEGQFYQKIARIKTTSGNLWCFSCIVSQLALSYPLYGRYEFRKGSEAIDLPALIQELGHAPIPYDRVV